MWIQMTLHGVFFLLINSFSCSDISIESVCDMHSIAVISKYGPHTSPHTAKNITAKCNRGEPE